MQAQISGVMIPVYVKKPLEGDRTSEFVPSGDFLEQGKIVEGGNTVTDDSGTFLNLGEGKFVNIADTEDVVEAA